MSAFPAKHWPTELYLTGPTIDRENRETWQESGSKDLIRRATEEVERRLAAYQPIETDAAIDKAMRELIIAGMNEQTSLPEIPPAPEPTVAEVKGRRTSGRRRRQA